MKISSSLRLALGITTVVFSLVATQASAAESRLALRQEKQELRQERRAGVAENVAHRVEQRFNRHEERLSTWIDRVTARIAEREAAGKDQGNAKAALETAKTSLAAASELGGIAVSKLQDITPENWEDQKADALAAREAVKAAQVAYAQVIKDFHKVIKTLKASN